MKNDKDFDLDKVMVDVDLAPGICTVYAYYNEESVAQFDFFVSDNSEIGGTIIAYLERISVHENYQRNGIGMKIMREVGMQAKIVAYADYGVGVRSDGVCYTIAGKAFIDKCVECGICERQDI